jgi:hypothetical protein
MWRYAGADVLVRPRDVMRKDEMNFLQIQNLWEDSDGMLQIEIKASDGFTMATQDVYVYPEDLNKFACELQTFPTSLQHRVTLELGSKDPGYYNYLLLRAFVHDSVGHSAIEMEISDNSKPPARAEAHFYLLCEPSLLNEVGHKISDWIKDMTVPLYIEWNNA